MNLIVIGMVVLLLAVGLSGCNTIAPHPDRDKFIGSWKSTLNEMNSYTLESDGSLIYFGIKSGSWTVKDGNKLEFYLSDASGSSTIVYNYNFVDSTTLILSLVGTGFSETYIKQ